MVDSYNPTKELYRVRYIKLITLTLMAAFLLAGISSTVAMAEDVNPNLLPTPTAEKPLKFTLSGGEGELLANQAKTKDRITCKKNVGEGSFTSSDAGKVTKTTFSECENPEKVKCNSKGAAAGTITVENSDVSIVDYTGSTKLLIGIVISPLLLNSLGNEEDIEIICGTILKLLLLGGVMGKIDNATGGELVSLTKVKEVLALFDQVKEDEQELLTCELLETFCKKGPFDLKIKLTAEGAEAGATLIQLKESVKFGVEAEVHY